MTIMMHFFEPEPDQLLYHYTSAEGAIAILRNGTLRLSEFSKMNDKSEYLYSKSKFIEAYQNREVFVEEVPRWMANIVLHNHEPSTAMMIGCMTEESDDVGLWERYADSAKGCVIGFDANWLASYAGVTIRKVSYDPDYLRDFVNSGLMMLQSHYEENPHDKDELFNIAAMFILDLYSFKDPRFCSENEVRISRLAVADETAPFGLVDVGGHRFDGKTVPAVPIKQRQGSYGPTRFIELPLRDNDKILAIRSLGFGPNINNELMERVKNAVSLHPEIELYHSDVPLR